MTDNIVEKSGARWYGVSHGNGNDGVSHSYPNYYVKTDKPFLLAYCAVFEQFSPQGYDFVSENLDVEGEAEYTISAMLRDPPEHEQDFPVTETDNGKWIVDDEPEEEYETEQAAIQAYFDGGGLSRCDVNGAWHITEVFPVDEIDTGAPRYESIEACFFFLTLKLRARRKIVATNNC